MADAAFVVEPLQLAVVRVEAVPDAPIEKRLAWGRVSWCARVLVRTADGGAYPVTASRSTRRNLKALLAELPCDNPALRVTVESGRVAMTASIMDGSGRRFLVL